ncbi:MAG: hypothetical protein RLZZ256_817 [Bacteroidota bacterium]
MVIGPKAVLEALGSGMPLDRIYLDQKAFGPAVQQIRKSAAERSVPILMVPFAKLDSFHVEGHEGCVAQKARVRYQELQDVISWVVDRGETPLFLILDGITDVRNIGGIARTAYCTGVHAIIIPDKGVGALQEDAILTSAGALEKITVCRVNSLLKAIDELHLNGIQVLASVMRSGVAISQADLTQPVAILLGGEEKGIYPALLKAADQQVHIPMAGDFDSLNVSVATGMMLYEAMKQRSHG